MARRQIREWGAPGLLLLLACWVLFRLMSDGVTVTVAFDGGSNLQVAASLASGDGYARTYGDPPVYPPDIQTHEPYILPAALLFWGGGISLFTSQLPNALYLVAFVATVFSVVRSLAGLGWAALATLSCLAVPELYRYGFNGYGEIVALCWWFAGTSVLSTRVRPQASAPRLVVGGALLGLAVATKTVLLIGLAATVIAYATWRVVQRASWVSLLREACFLTVGLAAPLLAVELGRLTILDGWDPYARWWSHEFAAILGQAGVTPGFGDTPGFGNKLHAHLVILANSMGLGFFGTVLLLLAPVICFLLALRDARRWNAAGLTTALMLGASIYLVWWLAITPTDKAWFRRIVNGVLMLELGGILAAAALISPLVTERRRELSHLFAAAPACLFLGLLSTSIWPQIAQAPRTEQTRETQDLMAAVNWLRQLPPDALLFGEGWYSAPAPALYAERSLHDLNQWPSLRLPDNTPLYLVADAPALQAHAFANTLARYSAVPQLTDLRYFQVYRLDTRHPKSAFSEVTPDPTSLRSEIHFLANSDYPYLFGFYGYDRAGAARWTTSDAEVLLQAADSSSFYMDIAVPPLSLYRFPGGIRIRVNIGSCAPSDAFITAPGAQRLTWPVPCTLTAGESVPVRIRTDNVVVALQDYRQLSVPVHGFGFGFDDRSAHATQAP